MRVSEGGSTQLTGDDAVLRSDHFEPAATHTRARTHTRTRTRTHTHTHVQCTAPGQPRMFDLLLEHRLELSVSSRQPRQRRAGYEQQRVKEQQKQMLEARDVCMVCRRSDLAFVRDLRWVVDVVCRPFSAQSLSLPSLSLSACSPVSRSSPPRNHAHLSLAYNQTLRQDANLQGGSCCRASVHGCLSVVCMYESMRVI